MKLTVKKTAAAALIALILAGCRIDSSREKAPQPIEPAPTVQAIDYSKQSVQQLEQSATTAQKVLSESQTKLTRVETEITEINRRITLLNEEISQLEKAETQDANALKAKRDALAEANQTLIVQNKVLVVAQQDVKQAQINVINVQNILVEKKAEQNKPPVVIVPDNPSQPEQPNQPSNPTQPEQPTEPTQPSKPIQPEQPAEPTKPSKPQGVYPRNSQGGTGNTILEQPSKPTQPEQPTEPTQPSKPIQPEQPAEPTKPSKPQGVYPGDSRGGTGNTIPEQPSKPTQPEQPMKPITPENPSVNLEGKQWRQGTSYFYSNDFNSWFFRGDAGYVEGYNGPRGEDIIGYNNRGYIEELDFDAFAKLPPASDFYGWHEGSVKDERILGIEIQELDKNGRIVKATRPEKFNIMFKNTPYTTYGALYTNEHDVRLFILTGSHASLSKSEYSNTYPVGEFYVNDHGVQTDRIDFIDEVKGSATYKGEVLARAHSLKTNSSLVPEYYSPTKPFKDGEITINAHFCSRPENTFTTATLNSKTLGIREFEQARMDIGTNSIRFVNEGKNLSEGEELKLRGQFFGKNASEAVGHITYRGKKDISPTNKFQHYNAIFSAEKQPK
ncbi:hypothetical protein BKK52_02190 [Rodentibacter trehalosifermentans]|uniref:Transferrin-binding protein B C-lobe/N-lobe beta barrel domain-containing protein n=1 Tax=Rodentibacter trehalosifermentans TaxID=1908263 RepID=A0A1V3J5E2_9PAST|nr:hypothetical protein [Rodentibacter trehalosifermentans]OOF50232.1 hypothetical protein BKK52_02190 [Rodentibacter trehalosifermentans]